METEIRECGGAPCIHTFAIMGEGVTWLTVTVVVRTYNPCRGA